MRLKSLSATNQRIKSKCVANIFMLCLLAGKVWSFANIKHDRFARQLSDEDFAATNPYHQPHFTQNRSVVVQLFEWKFVDIAAECRDFLGPQGYAGVQISPVLEHTVVKTDDLRHPWWERLEAVSYRLASRSGDEEEFWAMSRVCNENGVRIYADVVLNHMAAPLHYIGAAQEATADYIVNTLLETNVNLKHLNYSHVPYTHNDFHKPACMVLANTLDAHVIRNCQLNGHPDLDHSRGNVQKHIVEMLNKFVDMGVAGFRVDTAKYMWPIDLKNIFKQVKNLSTEFNFEKNTRPFVHYDVFDLGLDAVSKTEYSTYGVVSEYLYAAELSTILRRKAPLSSLINWGPALGFVSHEDAFVFIDSQDTQRGLPPQLGNNQILTYKQRTEYIMANVFMLVHPYGGIKRIMSSYYFLDTDVNQGPPVEAADAEEIRSPKYNKRNQCTRESGWVCEHRWPQMVSLIKVANYFRAAGNKEQSIIYFQTNGPNQVAFCRGQKAFVAINNDVENDFIKEVYGCLEPGVYCDMVTGGKKDGQEKCHGKMLEINEQGYIKLELSVADNKRGDNEEGVAAEEMQKEEEEEEDEGAAEFQSYGIVVIYVESKIKPTEEEINDASDDTQTGTAEEKSKDDEGDEGKPSTEEDEEQVVEGEEPETEQKQDNNGTDNEEPTEVQGEDEKGEEEAKENTEEPVEEEQATEEKSENEEQIEAALSKEGEDGEPDEDQDSNEPKDTEEAKESNEQRTSEEKENKPENEEESVKVEDENEENGELKPNSSENSDNAKEEEAAVEDSVKEEAVEPETGAGSVESAPEDTIVPNSSENTDNEKVEDENEENGELKPNSSENSDNAKEEEAAVEDSEKEEAVEPDTEGGIVEPDKDLDGEPAASGSNQSRNLDDGNTIEAEEQIEKLSAEIVDEAGDTSDTVTAKIQDIQKAGIFPNRQGDGNTG